MRWIIPALIIFVILISNGGCKKDDLVHLSDFEMKIYNAVNAYRKTQGLPEITLQYLMINDAQNYSKKMADGSVSYGTVDVMSSLNTLKNSLGGDESGAVVQFSEVENADTVVNRMIRDPVKLQVLKQDFNQTAVGSAKDNSGNWYVTQLFIHIP